MNKSVGDVVSALVKQVIEGKALYDTPIGLHEINNGYCEEFAYALKNKLRGGFVVDTPLGGEFPTHSFLKYRGKYYDAELPDGTPDPINLPIFARFHARYPNRRLVTNESSQTSKYGVSKKEWMEKYFG